MANGTTKPIRDVHEGDQVLATDPATGKTSARTVTATMSHDDNDLLDLTITDGDGHHGTLRTTDHHKMWSVSAGAWVLAKDLHEGDQLREPDGATASVVELQHRPGHENMLDLTVEVDHSFYVDYGGDAVLVHNCGNTNPFAGPVDEDVFVVDVNGNVIDLKPGEYLTGSPDGTWLQVRDANGNPTGVRFDGGHNPTTHTDPRALGPHVHVPGVTNPDGTPWLPKK